MDIKCLVCGETLDSQRLEHAQIQVCEKCLDIGLKVIKAYSKLLDEMELSGVSLDGQGIE